MLGFVDYHEYIITEPQPCVTYLCFLLKVQKHACIAGNFYTIMVFMWDFGPVLFRAWSCSNSVHYFLCKILKFSEDVPPRCDCLHYSIHTHICNILKLLMDSLQLKAVHSTAVFGKNLWCTVHAEVHRPKQCICVLNMFG